MQLKYLLDASRFHNIETFYREVAHVFSFPDHFGKNLDALYDCLTDKEDAMEVIWLQSEKSRSDFADDASQPDFFVHVVDTFRDVPGLQLDLQ